MTLQYIATLIILLASIIINIFLLWFAFNLTRQIRFYDDELRGIVSIIKNFTEHLNAVHEMEMFYGDQTLQSLMDHAVSFSEQLETFEYIYSLTEEEIDDETETGTET